MIRRIEVNVQRCLMMFSCKKAFPHWGPPSTRSKDTHLNVVLDTNLMFVHALDNEWPLHLHLHLKQLQRKHQETREGGELPASHQVSPLQLKVSLVPSLHDHQPRVGGSLPRHILVTCEGWNHRPAIDDQTHLEQMMWWDESDIHYKTNNFIRLDLQFFSFHFCLISNLLTFSLDIVIFSIFLFGPAKQFLFLSNCIIRLITVITAGFEERRVFDVPSHL